MYAVGVPVGVGGVVVTYGLKSCEQTSGTFCNADSDHVGLWFHWSTISVSVRLKFLEPGRLLAIDPVDTATKVSPDIIVAGVHRGDRLEIGVFGFSSEFFPFRFALGCILISSIRILWYLQKESDFKHAEFQNKV